jgi:hypothetical protein
MAAAAHRNEAPSMKMQNNRSWNALSFVLRKNEGVQFVENPVLLNFLLLIRLLKRSAAKDPYLKLLLVFREHVFKRRIFDAFNCPGRNFVNLIALQLVCEEF